MDPPNPQPLLLPPPPPTLSSSQQPSATRRLPPPCWSQDETASLIDAYRDKWYSLRRGNLRASHWQEVANDVASRCPTTPQKTSIQCRHKMEKLRKRYRSEIQRANAAPKGHKYPSSWVHFKRMDLMEKGSVFTGQDDEDDQEEDQEHDHNHNQINQDGLLLYPRGIKQALPIPNPNFNPNSNPNHNPQSYGNVNGFRIKIPGRVNPGGDRDDYPPPVYGSGRVVGPVEEMVSAIKMLGDGFVRMERMKMDMARQLESTRMEMEMKRTEMILESQRRLVDSFSKAVLERKSKKVKRMPTPEA